MNLKPLAPPSNPWSKSCLNQGMRQSLIFFCLLASCLGSRPAFAQQDPGAVRRALESWLNTQISGLPGQASYEIGPFNTSRLAPCSTFEVSRTNSASQAWGRSQATVRCTDTAAWRINVPIHIRIKGDYLITVRPITQGQVLTSQDFAIQNGDLTDMPARLVTDENFALGKTAALSIQAGTPLRSDMLKALFVIRQGQTVKVISRGQGFEVVGEGRAINNAAEGQLAQIKMSGGQVVSGLAKSNGIIEISQ